MKKILSLGLAGMAVLALSAAPAIACDGDKDASKTSAQTASSKSTCGSKTEGASASLVGAGCGTKASTASMATAHGEKGACNYSGQKLTAEECAKMMASMSPEECAKVCGYEGKMEMVNMNIKGMTCGGCESSVTTALEKVDGVVKVLSVNYKDGSALVCIDPTKTKAENLTQTVSNKGYEVQVIPAVATTGTTASGKTCSMEDKAACAAKETKATKTGAEGSK